MEQDYYPDVLPAGIRSRLIDNVNGLQMHVLEAGYSDNPAAGDKPERPCLLLLHGFPELAFSWRKVMPLLAQAGYHVIAPDLRGYGQTTGWAGEFADDISPFTLSRMAGDVLALLRALGKDSVDAVIGHDFGSPVAAVCALLRPDVFRSVVLMSAPFSGPPDLPLGDASNRQSRQPGKYTATNTLHESLAALQRPRVHYQWYYSGSDANDNMLNSADGLEVFLRNYYFHKSADKKSNRIFPLTAPTAEEFAKLPTYYIMDADCGMAETVAVDAPSVSYAANCDWLGDDELAVYASEYGRTGFQGGLQCYRCNTSGKNAAELMLFSGRTIDVPSAFIAGASDWGVYQFPGDVEKLQSSFCTDLKTCHLIAGAGHWLQQEQPVLLVDSLLAFLETAARPVVK